MTATLAAVLAGALGAVLAWVLALRALRSPPDWSLRTNVSGAEVPVVLGLPVAVAGVAALAAVSAAGLVWDGARTGRVGIAAALVLAPLAAAGWWDDRRGNESARGFAGHLSAGKVTGGVVKMGAGAACGLGAALVLYRDDPTMAVLTALVIPLAANLFNLLDRAPGRTGKAALAAALPLLAFGNPAWAVAAAGTIGALAAVLRADLGERGMLGDAGANPVGGLLGLGAAASFSSAGLTATLIVLAALNAASERWSFSEAISRNRVLRSLDMIGRK